MVLSLATAAHHFTFNFHNAFANFKPGPPAAEQDPLQNYIFLFAAVAAAYFSARLTCALVSWALPARVKSSPTAGRTLVVFSAASVGWGLYVAVGSPPPTDFVIVLWLVRNWERNAKADLAWCGRLFVLLVCWQALLGVVMMSWSVLAWGVARARRGQADGKIEKGVSHWSSAAKKRKEEDCNMAPRAGGDDSGSMAGRNDAGGNGGAILGATPTVVQQ